MPRTAGAPLRIATWNVNSVRARLPLIERFLAATAPDILCLQEIKVETASFPRAWFEARGYPHMAIHGQRNHHGVATLARIPLADVERQDWCEKGDARHVATRLPGGVVVHNFYVPAGGDIPDPEANPRFAHKLAFLDEMIAWSRHLSAPAILLGDLNVAPLETDVWSHRQLLNVVSHTPPETTRLAALAAADPGSTRCGISSPPRRRSSPGGPIARATGGPRIAAGDSTMSGSVPIWRRRCAG